MSFRFEGADTPKIVCEDGKMDIPDCLPPMLYCKSADDYSKSYIGSWDSRSRLGINVDHDLMIWLFGNAEKIKKYYYNSYRRLLHELKYGLYEDINLKISDLKSRIDSSYGLKHFEGCDLKKLERTEVLPLNYIVKR